MTKQPPVTNTSQHMTKQPASVTQPPEKPQQKKNRHSTNLAGLLLLIAATAAAAITTTATTKQQRAKHLRNQETCWASGSKASSVSAAMFKAKQVQPMRAWNQALVAQSRITDLEHEKNAADKLHDRQWEVRQPFLQQRLSAKPTCNKMLQLRNYTAMRKDTTRL